MLKDFFDRTFYPTQHHVTRKPYAAFVTHACGGKAIHSIEAVARTFTLHKAAEPVVEEEAAGKDGMLRLQQLGAKLAAAAAK